MHISLKKCEIISGKIKKKISYHGIFYDGNLCNALFRSLLYTYTYTHYASSTILSRFETIFPFLLGDSLRG